ncbi:MAG: hypothetical protein CME67_00655 [Halobacteriovoraceae bacterium]|nr:hypothetical protein [Halobacteriovoraceae bacterium]|tara:strand:- start:2661 stop:3152 length:492 start_codon:yes stop_codon:yes gene_type:complete
MKKSNVFLSILILVISACGGSNSSGSKDPAKRTVKNVDQYAKSVKHFENECPTIKGTYCMSSGQSSTCVYLELKYDDFDDLELISHYPTTIIDGEVWNQNINGEESRAIGWCKDNTVTAYGENEKGHYVYLELKSTNGSEVELYEEYKNEEGTGKDSGLYILD